MQETILEDRHLLSGGGVGTGPQEVIFAINKDDGMTKAGGREITISKVRGLLD